MRDPYEVLGLSPGASAEEVRAARRRLAKQHHPDVGGDTAAMQAINAAVAAVPEPAAEFIVDALPVEACHALIAALGTVGEVLDADEPYRIEGSMDGAFVTLELVPVAGGSQVTLSVDGPVSAEAVLNGLIAAL